MPVGRRGEDEPAGNAAQGNRMPGTRLAPLAVSVTVTVSAFLLFQVQPIVAKVLLPQFGGVPAVLRRLGVRGGRHHHCTD
jgi:hypothetical protein